MQVILIQNVAGLGKIDDIKDVSEGYARNFLFAKNLAMPATAKTIAEVTARHTRKLKNSESELVEQQAIAQKLDGWEVSLKEKTSAGGALYAAVGPQKVADILKNSGFNIDKNQILMKPIKEAGQHSAKVKFSHGLEADITITVNKI